MTNSEDKGMYRYAQELRDGSLKLFSHLLRLYNILKAGYGEDIDDWIEIKYMKEELKRYFEWELK